MQRAHLIAKVVFLTPEQGGFSYPHWSGVKPLMKVSDHDYTSCIVWAETEGEVFQPGVEYNVSLELPLWQHYRNDIYAGMPLQLSDGKRPVALGTIVSIIG
jgi:hypothetical protein